MTTLLLDEMADERTRALLQAIREKCGDDEWPEGLLNALEDLRIMMEVYQANADDPEDGVMQRMLETYLGLRKYTLALLGAGVEYHRGLSRLKRDLRRRVHNND